MILNKYESLLFYIVVYFFSGLLIGASKKSTKGINIFLFVLGIAGPVLLAAFRYQVGTDFNNYRWMYSSYAAMGAKQFFTSRELFYGWGVWFISKFAQLFGGERTFFGLFAILICMFGIKGIEHYEKTNLSIAAFAFFLGPFTSGLNVMKQAVAIAIVFWGLKYVYQKNLWKYLLVIMLAVTFHTSAIIAIPIYFIYKRKEDSIWNWRSLLAVFAAIIVSTNILSILSMLSNVDFMNISRFSSYSSGGTGNLSFFLSIFEFVIILLYQHFLARLDEKNKLLIVLMGLGASFLAIGFFSVFVKRISGFFTTYALIILFSSLPKKANTIQTRAIANFGFTLFFLIVFILYYFYKGQANIIPYQFIG